MRNTLCSLAYISHTFRIWKAISIKTQNRLGRDMGSRKWDKLDTKIQVGVLFLVFCLKNHAFFQNDWINLGRKIGFALYNAPTIDPSESDWCIFGYDKDKEEKIKALRQKALDLSESHANPHIAYINFVFVSFWTKDNESMVSDFLSDLLMMS
jgi:hypothetical protein